MKSKNLTKKMLAVLLLLISVAIIVIAFVGFYLPNLNKISNVIPDYKFGTEIDGVMEYRLKVDNSEEEKEVYVDSNGKIRGEVIEEHNHDEETTDSAEGTETTEATEHENKTEFNIETRTIKANPDEILTKDNYEKVKEIIKERLKKAHATEYAIRVNEETGDLVVELSQNDNTDFLYEVGVAEKGKFEVIDNQTGVILLNREHLKNAGVYATAQDTNSYIVYLQLELTDDGAKILRELSKKYVKYTDDNGEEQTDYIAIQIDGSSIMTTYFDEEYTQNIINVPIGQGISDRDELQNYIDSVGAISNMLNLEELPISYTLDSQMFVKSALNDNFVKELQIALSVLLMIIIVCLGIKFKVAGLVAGILNAAFIGLVLLVLRALQIVTFGSIISLFGMIIVNIVFLKMYLKNLANDTQMPFVSTLKSFYSIMVPVIVISFIFTFFGNAGVTGIGFVLFWGMLIQILFNSIITKNVLDF